MGFDFSSKNRATIEAKINDPKTSDFNKLNLEALLSNTEHRQIFDLGDGRYSSESRTLGYPEKALVNRVWGQAIYDLPRPADLPADFWDRVKGDPNRPFSYDDNRGFKPYKDFRVVGDGFGSGGIVVRKDYPSVNP